ncbi:transcriptional regulator family: Fungal Specific TF [Paecilomyces variotii]|nr:transcriptional regulator family: Fungal Specific TF [Paecilomyces variotii]
MASPRTSPSAQNASAGEQTQPIGSPGYTAVTPGGTTAGRKRKASESSNAKDSAERRKITRACDYCKEKKTRCTGTLPCLRCTKLSLSCEYNAAYSRGLPPSPPPAPESTLRYVAASPAVSQRTPKRLGPQRRHKSSGAASPRNSPEPGATDLEGNYLGPASGISFLNRVWRRLNQDEVATIPSGLRDESSKSASVFMFGDRPFSDYGETGFSLPPLHRALELIEVYFDFAIVTYRFLHRGLVESWLKEMYEREISSARPPTGDITAKAAILLMVFAIGTMYEEKKPGNAGLAEFHESERWYVASKAMSYNETGKPRLETIQARLGQCLYLLSSSRANECWYRFGTTLQLVTALGLHRRRPAKLLKDGKAYLENELRKRTFWSAYILDKYLSVTFGRPRLLHDEDIDQDLPDEVNDEDMLPGDQKNKVAPSDCVMTGTIMHIRLCRLVGEISRQVYTIRPSSKTAPLEAALRLTLELEEWKESLPPLFKSIRPSSLVAPLCRQSQVLQLAYSHAMIHATRSFLLNDFTDFTRRPLVTKDKINCHVQKCIDAAKDTMLLVDDLAAQGILVQSFWFTHYVCFCAIIVVYIYTIQHHRLSSSSDADHIRHDARELFSFAERCQRHLAKATRRNCPSRRYSIILEELRREVHRQINSNGLPRPVTTKEPAGTDTASERRHYSLEVPGQREAPEYDISNYPPPFLPELEMSELTPSDDVGQDLDFLSNQLEEGSVWWTQLDSWAFSSIHNDSSIFNG